MLLPTLHAWCLTLVVCQWQLKGICADVLCTIIVHHDGDNTTARCCISQLHAVICCSTSSLL
jgi:hypothetical protein